MDHNGLYTDLDSFTNITANNSFSDTCPTLPPLNNFKYQQTNLSTNIYQQPVQTIHDQQQQHHSTKSSSSSSLPQTQININNCNNNIFFHMTMGFLMLRQLRHVHRQQTRQATQQIQTRVIIIRKIISSDTFARSRARAEEAEAII